MEEASRGDIGAGLGQIATEEHPEIESSLSQVEQIAIKQEVCQTSFHFPAFQSWICYVCEEKFHEIRGLGEKWV